MTCPRRIVPGTTYLLTRRWTQRRFMLVPRGLVHKLFGYRIALAEPQGFTPPPAGSEFAPGSGSLARVGLPWGPPFAL